MNWGPLEDIDGNVWAWMQDKEREEACELFGSTEDEEQREPDDESGV